MAALLHATYEALMLTEKATADVMNAHAENIGGIFLKREDLRMKVSVDILENPSLIYQRRV